MASKSTSQGEGLKEETAKAFTAQPSKGTSVNRKLRAALSPSPDRSTTDSSRDRSRSPYRLYKGPRGEKRRRDDDYPAERYRNDNRRAQDYRDDRHGRYEHRNRDHGRDGDRYGRYEDRQRDDERGNSGRHDRYDHYDRYDRHDRYEHQYESRGNEYKKTRTRSRSPRNDDHNSRRDHGPRVGDERPENDRPTHRSAPTEQSIDDPYADFRKRSMSSQGTDATPALQSAENSKTPKKQPTNGTNAAFLKRNAAAKSTRFAELDSDGQALTSAAEATEPVAQPVDEDAAIEERRKRRAAILAKHRQTPLLAQALGSGNAPESASPQQTMTTPYSEGSGSPLTAPATPANDSRPGSPPSFTITDDAQLANSNSAQNNVTEGDEPSAADYDPTIDMQEDRARSDKKRSEDVSASQYDETLPTKQDVLMPDSIVETVEDPATKPTQPSDDMFASDNDDDEYMFAPTAAKKTAAVALPQAKELDMSLMDNWDDPEGYYRVILGEILDGSYQVQASLGKGMFSNVVRCIENATGQLKAVKIIRTNDMMKKAAVKEMEFLQRLMDADPDDKKHLIRLERSFTHKGHLCIVFENLSINLREVLKKFGRDCGIHLKAVRAYSQQMFLGLSLMRKCNIIHADLKPDNVLVNDERNMLKICDLGSASDSDEADITPYLVSRFYRAPEVMLGIPYDFGIDMWSTGCTLFELFTGKILFTGRNNNQMLRSIIETRGKFTLKMLKKAEFGGVHFDDNLNFRSMEKDKITGRDITRLINYQKPVRDLKTRIMAGAGKGDGKGLPDAELKELNLFVDLLDRCLNLNPEKRISPADALKHPFIHRAPGK